MSKRLSPLSVAVRVALLAGLLPVGSYAIAQDQDSAATLDRIEVTGSRIKKAEIEGLSPVQVVSREQIERTGLTSIGDVLQQLTASGSSLNTKFNSSGNFGFPPDGGGVGAGSTTVDLRHLGSKRVLVLVDGVRWVNESSASGVSTAVDLNTIPLAAVDRIEVLEDGASTLYGSDAIGGVVNIITKRNVEGAEINAQYGEFDKGGGETQSYDFSIGGQADKLDFFFAASFVEQKRISSAAREQSRFPVPGTGVAFGSSGTPSGRFIFTDPGNNPALCPGGTCDLTTPNGSSFPGGVNFPNDFIPFTSANRFNFSPFNLLLTPNQRENLFAKVDYEFAPSVRWYARFSYTERESVNQAAPEPIFLGPAAGTGNPLADEIVISRTNPFNPFGVDLVSGQNFFLLGRRPVEGGPRIFEQDVETIYFATGLEGSFDLGERTYFWDANYVRGENEAKQTTFGSYNLARIAQGLGPVANCTAPCVPINLFGGAGTLTRQMLDFIQPTLTDVSENNLEMFTANLSGDLFDLPAGALSFAVGYEHRSQDGFFRPDALIVAGESNGVPALPTDGSFDVDEAYLELNVPLLADLPLAERIDLSLASRYSDYSTFGDDFTNKIGLRWQVNDELLIRGTFAEGFRAPSIGELFGSDSRFDATITDPCSNATNPGIRANCAALGVPAGFAQPNPQISITTGGNNQLDAETSDSYTAGFVWSPGFATGSSWADRLDIEFTWYRHELDGAIQAIDAQTQLDLCVQTLDPTFCQGITRAVTGDINGFNNRLTNLGEITTDGWDADIFWVSPEFSWGRLNVSWQNTIVESYKAVGANGIRQPNGVGVEVNDSAIPEWTSSLSVEWTLDAFSAAWTVRHIDSLTEDCSDFVGLGLCSNDAEGTNTLGSTTYHDFQVGYRLDLWRGVNLTAGLNNAFDKDPPLCFSCSLNGLDASTFDLPGQVWYLRASAKF
ncbi:MAG TPA: TonB-dependent receptor [Xanthomonadales bacterium]|nr:TonB-dependent receptor [Xanthomonadales bacterium]